MSTIKKEGLLGRIKALIILLSLINASTNKTINKQSNLISLLLLQIT